jgi:hypothetical protein
LWWLADQKANLKGHLEFALKDQRKPEYIRFLENEIELINKEALSYRGKGPGDSDLFIACLVHDLHFEVEVEEE